jgi:hypothetical protein
VLDTPPSLVIGLALVSVSISVQWDEFKNRHEGIFNPRGTKRPPIQGSYEGRVS